MKSSWGVSWRSSLVSFWLCCAVLLVVGSVSCAGVWWWGGGMWWCGPGGVARFWWCGWCGRAAYGLVEGVGEVGFVVLGVAVGGVRGGGCDVLPGVVVEGLVEVVVGSGDFGGVVVG